MVDPIAMALPGLATAAGMASLLSFGLQSAALRITTTIVVTPSALLRRDLDHLFFSKIKPEFAGIAGGAFALLSVNAEVDIKAGDSR